MKQTTAIKIVMSIAIAACANMAEAQWTQFQGANGSSWGTANRTGNSTYYHNANGSAAGTSYRAGNTTYYNNANGSAAGTSY